MHVNAGSAVDIMVSTGPPPADFSISAAPSSVTVQQGGTGSTTIRTTVVGSPGSVTLTVAVSPSGTGVTVSLTPASLSAGANSNLSIIATSTATAGPYTITITGTEGATTHSTTVSLTVTVRPLLRFTSSSLDFGTVNLNKLVSRNISVTNLGTSAISITTLSITLGTADAAAYTPTSFCLSPLPPSKTCTIKVAFRADAVGTLTSTLNVTDTAPFSPQQISLTGTVINPLAQFSPRPLWFGNVVVGQNKTLPVQLTNIGQTDLIITGIVLGGTNPGDFSQANNCPAVLPPTASCTIQGTFTPTAVGTRTAILIVTDNVAGGKSTTTFTGVGK